MIDRIQLYSTRGIVSLETSESIDLLRGAACLGVIWGHSIGGNGSPNELNGAFWVWIFLVVCGYLAGVSLSDKGYGIGIKGCLKFIYNRLLRIVPLAYLALVIGLICFVITRKEIPKTTLRQFLFVPPDGLMSLSGPLWTLSVEIQFYFIAIFLAPLFDRFYDWSNYLKGLMFVGLSLVIAWVSFSGNLTGQPRTLLGNIPFLVIGLWLSRIEPISTLYWRNIKILIVPPLISCAWWLQNFHKDFFWGWKWSWGGYLLPYGGAALIAIVVACIMILFTSVHPDERWRVSTGGFFVKRWLIYCGFYCYGIYVWHAVLGTLNEHWFGVSPGFIYMGFLLVSIPLAIASYAFIEKPLLSFRLN